MYHVVKVFYLNVVGYKDPCKMTPHLVHTAFYLNVVGYKGCFFAAINVRSTVFYLNVVGYKALNQTFASSVVRSFI